MTPVTRRSATAALAIGAVTAVVIGGLLMLRTPADERPYLTDRNRLADLQALENAVNLYWGRYETLPMSLDDLRRLQGVALRLRDPVSGDPYEYRPIDARHYEVCAIFERDSSHVVADFWSHGAGRSCFRVEAREHLR